MTALIPCPLNLPWPSRYHEIGSRMDANHRMAWQGFQQQVKRWPEQPVQRAIAWVAGLPRSARVVDFGCGDALLAQSVPQAVACLDLVASHEGVIACNMAHTPLGKAEAGPFACAQAKQPAKCSWTALCRPLWSSMQEPKTHPAFHLPLMKAH